MDHLDAEKITLRMAGCTKRLQDMAESVGLSRQVRDFASERRKNLLAKYCPVGESAAKAEISARKDPEYLAELDKLAEQSRDAEITITRWDAEKASFEACRSLLSFNRESLRQLEG